MQLTKLLVQSLHLRAVGPRVVTLLPILGLLVLSLLHRLGRQWADPSSIDESRHEDDGQWRQNMQSIRRLQYTRETGWPARTQGRLWTRECQRQDGRKSRLQAEIDREQRGLKSRKLRPWERPVCCDASDEGLEYLRP